MDIWICFIFELLRDKTSRNFSLNFFRFLISPGIFSLLGVSTTSAPYARSKFLLSSVLLSGITIMALYPLAAAFMARPIPVFPLVGSILVAPGFNFPAFSAASIILNAALSFTLLVGFNDSNLI